MVGAGALILGGLGFGVFWGAGLLGVESSRELGLLLHGAWMAALAVGVVQLVRPLRGTAVVMGAIFLLVSLPLEGRMEGNGTPEPGTAAATLFARAVLFVSIGFVLLGARSLRAKRPPATVAPSA